MTRTGHIYFLFEHAISVSLFATEEDKFSKRSFLLQNAFLQSWLLSARDRDIHESVSTIETT